MPTKVEISSRTILFTLGTIALVWFLLEIREIILLLFLVFILMAALRPTIDRLVRFRIPKVIAVLLVYLVFIFFIGLLGGSILPQLVTQTIRFWEKLPEIINRIIPFVPLNFAFITQQLSPVGGDLLKVTLGFFSNFLTILTIIILTFYLLLEREDLEESFKSLFGEEKGNRIIEILWKIEEKLGAWIRGQVVLMFLIGLLSFIGLTALGVDYALPLAITAGLLEIVPFVGSIIASIPAILVAFVVSPVLALAVIALYFIIHQSEGNLIAPTVMKKAVGLPPVVTLIALMIGAKLAGILGALLAIPAVVVLQVILQELTIKKSD
ncbi:MAG: AI-2E family transporter [Candidatus Gottesmanbacteria bacterium]